MAERSYVTVRRNRSADIDSEPDGEDYLARTVFEDHELIDIGVVDRNGDPIMARKRTDPIGFIRWKS